MSPFFVVGVFISLLWQFRHSTTLPQGISLLVRAYYSQPRKLIMLVQLVIKRFKWMSDRTCVLRPSVLIEHEPLRETSAIGMKRRTSVFWNRSFLSSRHSGQWFRYYSGEWQSTYMVGPSVVMSAQTRWCVFSDQFGHPIFQPSVSASEWSFVIWCYWYYFSRISMIFSDAGRSSIFIISTVSCQIGVASVESNALGVSRSFLTFRRASVHVHFCIFRHDH